MAPRNAVFYDDKNDEKDRLLVFAKNSILSCKIPRSYKRLQEKSNVRYFSTPLLKGYALKVIDRSPKQRRMPSTTSLPPLVLKKKGPIEPLSCVSHSKKRPAEFDHWLKAEIHVSAQNLNPLQRVKRGEYNRRLATMKACSRVYPSLKMSFENDNPESMRLITVYEKYKYQSPVINSHHIPIDHLEIELPSVVPPEATGGR